MSVEIIIIDSMRHFSSNHPELVKQSTLGYLAISQDRLDRLEDEIRRTLIPKNKTLVCQATGGYA